MVFTNKQLDTPIMLYSFLCLSSLPDALLVSFSPEDGVFLTKSLGTQKYLCFSDAVTFVNT